MYKIFSNDELLGYSETIPYIKKAPNGCYVFATAKDAQGIAYKSNPYSLPNSDLDGHPVAIIVEASVDEIATEVNEVKSHLDYVMMMTDTSIPTE